MILWEVTSFSLFTLLRQPDVRKRFSAEFPKPRVVMEGILLAAPANPFHAGLVGTAFDYLLRVHVAIVNAKVNEREWVAESAIDLLRLRIASNQSIFVGGSRRVSSQLVTRAETIVWEARREYDICIRQRSVSSKMTRYALLLGQLETFFRSGLLSDEFGKVRGSDVEDLRRLITIARRLPDNPFAAKRVCVMNPTFGTGSNLVGGADADILVDETLIEFKTTKHLRFTREIFNQLVGYYLLSEIGGGITLTGRTRPQIRQIAAYFARYGVFVRLPVTDFVNPHTFAPFLRWFKKRIQGSLVTTTFFADDGTSVTF